MTRGQIITGVDVDGYPVKVFCPHTPEGEATAKWLMGRMTSVNCSLNYAISREALMKDLSDD